MAGDRFFSEIERLRGVACLLVLIQHTTLICPLPFLRAVFPPALYDGRAGLPLFFVISGFIITRILPKSLEDSQCGETFCERIASASLALRSFFIRRFFRIFPLVIFHLFLTAGVFYWAYAAELVPYQPDWVEGFFRTCAEIFFCVYNLSISQHITKEAFHYGSLGPCWSLSVEWQFYFFWPLLLLLLRTRSRQSIFALSSFFFFLCVARPLIYSVFECEAYYHTLSNLDGLFLGASLAIFASSRSGERGNARPPKPLSAKVRYIPPILILVLWAYPGLCEKGIPSYGFAVIWGCAGSLVWLAIQNSDVVLAGRFTSRVFEFLGKRSYAIYITQLLTARFSLWIVSTLGLFQTSSGVQEDGYALCQFFVFLGIFIPIVELSHRYIEEPARRFGRKIAA